MNDRKVAVISFVGFSGSGKTTFLERLIPLLRARGLRIAVIKHDAHRFEVDKEGKDTWRFTRAGAEVAAIASGEKAAIIEARPLSLEDMLERIQDVDLILTEGYKTEDNPKIEIHRQASGKSRCMESGDLLALVTDGPFEEGVACFGLEDHQPVADFIMKYLDGLQDDR